MIRYQLGRQICGDLNAASQREWLVTDGVGGYAMGTVAGLRTRRYHGLLIVAGDPLGRRHLGLAALDARVVIGDRRVSLATHEWSGGVIDPTGPSLLLATGGEVDLAGPNSELTLNGGDAAFVAPDEGPIKVSGPGRLWWATTGDALPA